MRLIKKYIMRRSIYNQLLIWKESTNRKPLMLYGARQVGKTYILKEFGRKEFDNMVYVNCYLNPAIKTLFSQDKDIDRILLGLSALSGEEIKPGRTMVFLDEVQEVPEVVASLKYFCEDARDIYVVVAGSLLGVLNMEGCPFPTGKVDIMHMYPMTYVEFLEALGEDQKLNLLDAGQQESTVNSILPNYIELLRQYYFVGGMPEAVAEYIQSIPSQLAKENKKFIFGAIKKGARAGEYERAIQWLVDAGLIYKVCRLSKVAIPLSFYMEKDAFKLFLLDVGLLGAMSQVPPALMLIGNNVFSEFKGAFTENYVLTQMIVNPATVVGYYSKENSTMELDFVVQAGSRLLPIEVKAEENVKSKSLRQFITVDSAGSGLHGFRFSMKGYESQEWISNIPLFAVTPFINKMVDEGKVDVV